MTEIVENKLSELLELIDSLPNKYDLAPEICFEIMYFCSDTHTGAQSILDEAKELYFEHVEDVQEDNIKGE